MSDERIEVHRTIDAPPEKIFAVLTDPIGHVAIDASGMLMDATGSRVGAVGDEFVVHMDREALGDLPMGRYDITVTIAAFEADREVAWTVLGTVRPPVGHVYGYRLEPADGGTLVTSYCDWSTAREDVKHRFPIVPESSLRNTLGILERVVRRGYV